MRITYPKIIVGVMFIIIIKNRKIPTRCFLLPDVIKLNLNKLWNKKLLCQYIAFSLVIVLPNRLTDCQMHDLLTIQRIFRSIFWINRSSSTLLVPPQDHADFKNPEILKRIVEISKQNFER